MAQIQSFKREHGLSEGDGEPAPEEIDLRAEDDAAIAAQLEEEERKRREEEETRAAEEAARKAAQAEEGEPEEAEEAKPKRTRARGGSRRKKSDAGKALEGTFDHGEEGYGLWLEPAVQDDAVYAEHWAGHRPVTVTIEEDQIVIKRAGEDSD